MKIQCQSCQAKYTIADEKVLGKVVKIRCKKCSATIVINGNEHQPQAEDAAETHVFDYANQSNEQWTVNVADGDQRTMTSAEIASEYRAGVINDETYCWKDGMADWLPLREIEQLYGALKLGGGHDVAVEPAPQAAPLFAASATPVESPFAAQPHTNGNGNGHGSAALFGGGAAAAVEQHAPAAARRSGGRAQGADLFGNVEKAGGEDDVMTSAQAGGLGASGASASEEKLTGQRNENSVLFSLSALTEKAKEPTNRTTASADGSGLIDIRALSANMDEGEKKKKDAGARVDDIMNLSGGGAFGAALAAPILAPPPLEPVDMGVMSASGAPPKQSKTLVFAILGGCAFIAIAIVAAVALTRGPASDTKASATSGTTSAPTAEPTNTVAAADPHNTPPTGATAPSTDNTPPPPGTGQTASKAPAVAAGGSKPAGGGAVAKADHAAAPAAPAAPSPPKDLNSALSEAAGKKADAPAAGGGGSTAPFDRGAAAGALGSVNVQSCAKPGGPTGSGHVTVTFSPDGSVKSAEIDGGPFPGTPVGGCIAGKYRGVHVPPFAGANVRVGKSFTLN
jgi:predicted Zn finger-like uncharacterized protein